QIAEANFPTLDKDKTREVVTEIDNAIPDDERVIGLDRVLAAVDRSQIVPKNVEGVKADPPKIFFGQTPAVLINLDGKAIWSPNQGQRSQVRGQHQLGPVPARAVRQLFPARRIVVAPGEGPGRTVGPCGGAAGELLEASRRRQLEGRESGRPGQKVRSG